MMIKKTEKIKFIALDLDGTLLKNSWMIHPKNLKVIKKINQEEIKIIIATGRSPSSSIKFARKCFFSEKSNNNKNYLICYSGGNIIEFTKKSYKIIRETFFSNLEKEKILKFIVEENLRVWIYGERKNCYFKKLSLKILILELVTFIIPRPLKKMKNNEKMYKFIIFCKNNDHRTLIKEKLKKNFDFNVDKGNFNVIEVNPKNTNKFEAVKFLCEKKLNLKLENVLSCGDAGNDKKLIENSGIGVAMKNASEEVKNVANYITTNHKKGGVAKVLEKFLNIK